MLKTIGFILFYCSFAMSADLGTKQEIVAPKILDHCDDSVFIRLVALGDGQKALKAGNIEQALSDFKIVATHEGGTAEGMYWYGATLLSKFKTRPDDPNFALGLRYLEVSAKARFYLASKDLGIRYQFGDGVEESLPKAIECFERNKDERICKYHLGSLLYGVSTTVGEKIKGLRLMIESANSGYKFAEDVVNEFKCREELEKLYKDAAS